MEPLIFNEIKLFQQVRGGEISSKRITTDFAGFSDRLHVLLIAYLNLAISQEKLNNLEYSVTVYGHGYRMARKYLGEDHFFTLKFMRKITTPDGINANYTSNNQRPKKDNTHNLNASSFISTGTNNNN